MALTMTGRELMEADDARRYALNRPATPAIGAYLALLRLRARVGGVLYRRGWIERTTCFRWEVDAAIGEME